MSSRKPRRQPPAASPTPIDAKRQKRAGVSLAFDADGAVASREGDPEVLGVLEKNLVEDLVEALGAPHDSDEGRAAARSLTLTRASLQPNGRFVACTTAFGNDKTKSGLRELRTNPDIREIAAKAQRAKADLAAARAEKKAAEKKAAEQKAAEQKAAKAKIRAEATDLLGGCAAMFGAEN